MAEITKDQLNTALSNIRSMKNLFKSFEKGEEAILALTRVVGGIGDLEKTLEKLKEQVAQAQAQADAENQKLNKVREDVERRINEANAGLGARLKKVQADADLKIAEVDARVTAIVDKEVEVIQKIEGRKKILEAEIIEAEKRLAHVREAIDALKAKL